MSERRGIAREGAARVLRHQRILWWIFSVGFLLAWLGSLGMRTAANGLLGHSFAANGIAGQVQLPTLLEALAHPTLRMGPLAGGSLALDLVFLVFLLFVGGGTLVVYRDDRRLDRPEFFAACGLWFWRLVRLSLLSLVPLALAGGTLGAAAAIARRVAEASPVESRAIAVNLIGLVLAFLLFLGARIWFDVAQARLVVEGERAMWRTALAALRTTAGSIGTLAWLYARVSLLVIGAYAVGAWIWLRVPGHAFALSFLVLQAVLLVQLAARLWLRASVVAWYAARADQLAAGRVEATEVGPTEESIDVAREAPQPTASNGA